MAKNPIDDLEFLILGHLCEILETPAGPGVLVGLVDRNGSVSGVINQGERMPGGIMVLRSLDRSGLNLEGAVRIAREGAMES